MNVDCPLCKKLHFLDALPPEDIVGSFSHSVAFLGPWQYYTGYCVLVARAHVSELHHLPKETRGLFMEELCRVAGAIERVFQPWKLNVESLGNQVPHLHWHLFPRRADDPLKMKAVWLALERAEHDLVEKIRMEQGSLPRTEIAVLLREQLESQ